MTRTTVEIQACKRKEIWDDTEHEEVMTHGNVSRSFFSPLSRSRKSTMTSYAFALHLWRSSKETKLHMRSLIKLCSTFNRGHYIIAMRGTRSDLFSLSRPKAELAIFTVEAWAEALFRRITILRPNLHNKKLRQRLWADGGCWPCIIRLI